MTDSQEPKELRLPDPEVRQAVKNMAGALYDQMVSLEEANDDILAQLTDLQKGTTQIQINQSRIIMGQENTLNAIDSALAKVTQSLSGLALQVRDLTKNLDKDKPSG